MLVDRLLQDAADRTPERVALVSGSQRLTYAELNRAADRLAAGLTALGLQPGDRVVIHVENSVEAVLALFGTLKAGGVFVLVNPTVKAEKLAHILNDCAASILIGDHRAGHVLGEAVRRVPALRAVAVIGGERDSLTSGGDSLAPAVVPFWRLLAAEGTSGSAPNRIDVDLAALIYTSGSTGRPKGVMLSHLNILAATTSINAYLQNTRDDVILDLLPLSFDYGLYQLFLAFQSGACVVLERSFAYPAVMLDLIARERVTGLPIVPMMAALLLKHDLAQYDLSCLRYMTNTGAALPAAHIAALRERLPHVRLFSMYGLTECKRVSYLDPDEIDRRPASVGKPMENVEVYLVDGDGSRLDSGEGELVIRGSNVMQGYWGAQEETDRVLRPAEIPGERVLYSGDIFRIDDDGYMYFISRTDDIIKCRGQKVSPREVEEALYRVPGVNEVAVVGVPDPVMGECIKAFVTVTPGCPLTEQDLLRHCADLLEDILIPRSIEIVSSLPRTDTGKISRRALEAHSH